MGEGKCSTVYLRQIVMVGQPFKPTIIGPITACEIFTGNENNLIKTEKLFPK